MNAVRSVAALLVCSAAAVAAPVASFEDIAFWVGEGSQQAALAIDWDGAADLDEALVWGYRWDGPATGEQMLRDVLAADARLFAKMGPVGVGLGVAVFGLGYDANDDGDFALNDGTVFDASGIAHTGPADDAYLVQPDDLYREGWLFGYWHYGIGRREAGQLTWLTSQFGATQSVLADGEWHSFAFATTLNFDEFAQTLSAAAGPPALPGDFNADGRVDAADYTFWRDTESPDPDAYATWVTNYGRGQAPAAVPESNASVLASLTFLIFTSCSWRAS